MPPNKLFFLSALQPTSMVRENTRAIVAQSRQLLKETEAMAKGYLPSRDQKRLLHHLATARRRADDGAMRVQQQRRLVKELIAKGADASQATMTLTEYEKASSQYWTEMEGLLDKLDKAENSD